MDKKSFLKNASNLPGIYQMLDEQEQVIYVGKARNLKKRLSHYFRDNLIDKKTQALMQQVVDIKLTVTANENEALLLENNLIKQLKPRYNVLFRDDKSYPYIYLSSNEDFPRLAFHRGAQKAKGQYFGPYPSSTAVRESLQLLQKIFPVRQCEDSFYRARTRPCLQYQIKRCSAPCVELVDKATYQKYVEHVTLFLQGKEQQVMDELVKAMDQAASAMEYERAAHYRDQIAKLRSMQAQQTVTTKQNNNVDVFSVAHSKHTICIYKLVIRRGQLLLEGEDISQLFHKTQVHRKR